MRCGRVRRGAFGQIPIKTAMNGIMEPAVAGLAADGNKKNNNNNDGNNKKTVQAGEIAAGELWAASGRQGLSRGIVDSYPRLPW